MAKMTTCKTCEKEVASSAEVCPGCGARLKMGIGMKILIALGSLIILVGIITVVNIRNDKSGTTATLSSASESIDQYKSECQQIGYNDLARDPNKYVGNKVKFTGKVVQVLESGKDVGIRVNVTKSAYGTYADTIWVDYKKASENDSRILENDIVDVWGTVQGLKKYNTIMGAEETIPDIIAREVGLSPSTVSPSPSVTNQAQAPSVINSQTNEEKTVNSTSSKHNTNARFGFSIDYPSTFSVKNEPPTNGDGMVVHTPDGHSTITAYGSNTLEWDVNYFYEQEIKSHPDVTYKAQSGNWYVVSWNDGDTVGYTKGVVGKGSKNAFVIEYPKTEQQIYGKVIDSLSASFKTPRIEEGH